MDVFLDSLRHQLEFFLTAKLHPHTREEEEDPQDDLGTEDGLVAMITGQRTGSLL